MMNESDDNIDFINTLYIGEYMSTSSEASDTSTPRSPSSQESFAVYLPHEDDERTVSSVSMIGVQDVKSLSMAILRRPRDHPTNDRYDTEDDSLKTRRSKDHPKEEDHETEDNLFNASDNESDSDTHQPRTTKKRTHESYFLSDEEEEGKKSKAGLIGTPVTIRRDGDIPPTN